MTARGDRPDSPAAQELARRWTDLIDRFTMGDAGIQESLSQMWQDKENIPYPSPYTEEEEKLIHKAVAIYRGNGS